MITPWLYILISSYSTVTDFAKFLKVYAQVGVLFKGDDKFTGEMNYAEAGGHKGLIGWLNESGNILSGYKNDPKPKQPKPQSKQIPF